MNLNFRLDDVDCHVIGVQQKRADGPVLQGGNNMLQLPESITLSVRGSQQQQQVQPGKKSDANAVANILATRGITVSQ